MGAMMGAFFTILYAYDKVDFARRQFLTRRLLDSQPAGYRLLTGHGKGRRPWDDIHVGGAFKHILIDHDFAENIFPPSSDA